MAISLRVLVTDGGERSTLAVVRSLGRLGVHVIVSHHKLPCLASVSRYCARSVTTPSAVREPQAWVDFMAQWVAGEEIDVLLPMTDMSCLLVASHRSRFGPAVSVPMPGNDTVLAAMDKSRLVQRALALGVPVPKTWFVESLQQIEDQQGELPYPVVIKPRFSKQLSSAGWLLGSVDYAVSAEELLAKLRSRTWPGGWPMVQERVQGQGSGAFLLFAHGAPKAAFFHRRLREKPPSGGVSVMRESIEPHAEMYEYAVRLLSDLQWHGVAMVEFKVEAASGRPRLMEVNPRFWGSLQLAIDAGMDFPKLLHELMVRGDVTPQFDYRCGVRSRWLLGDLDHLLARLRRSKAKLGLPSDAPGRWTVLREFLRFNAQDTHNEVERPDDPAPSRFERVQYLKDLLRLS